MSANSFGQLFRLTSFGESHGPAIGGVIDGCPAGLTMDIDHVQSHLDRRRPGSTSLGTARDESDKVEFLSGIFEGKTTGSPIGFIIRNKDSRSKDYDQVKNTFRPSHADFTYEAKYGHRDHRGGGRSSARETACRVVGGAIASLLLKNTGMSVSAYVSAVGDVSVKTDYTSLDLGKTYDNEVRCPDGHMANFMRSAIEKVRKEGDSLGGIVSCVVKNCPVGLGEPVFQK
jgi:chorismate synthase